MLRRLVFLTQTLLFITPLVYWCCRTHLLAPANQMLKATYYQLRGEHSQKH